MLPVVAMEWRVYECVVIGLTQDLLQFLILDLKSVGLI